MMKDIGGESIKKKSINKFKLKKKKKKKKPTKTKERG